MLLNVGGVCARGCVVGFRLKAFAISDLGLVSCLELIL